MIDLQNLQFRFSPFLYLYHDRKIINFRYLFLKNLFLENFHFPHLKNISFLREFRLISLPGRKLKECQSYLYPRNAGPRHSPNLRHAATIISRGVRTRGFGLPVKQAISSTCYVTSPRLGQYSMSRFIRDLLPSGVAQSLSFSLFASLNYTYTLAYL